MGNCLRSNINNRVSSQDEKHEPVSKAKAIKHTKAEMASNLEQRVAASASGHGEKKKTVRFKLQEDHEDHSGRGISSAGDSKSGVVRIKLVLTQEELKQLLNYKKDSDDSSVEQLLCAFKSRGRRVSDESISSSWSPDLESIPEV